jgi:hypothetical protein
VGLPLVIAFFAQKKKHAIKGKESSKNLASLDFRLSKFVFWPKERN